MSVCAVCHSDTLYADGAWGGTLPAVYGHEGAGIVDAIGDGVNTVAMGDSVIVSLVRSCGECFYCRKNQHNLCNGTFSTDEPNRTKTVAGGIPVQRGLRTGCFAEYAIVHHSQVVKIPDGIKLSSAALLACGVATGFGAVRNTAKVESGSTVIVIGAGGVGLNAIQAASLCNPEALIAIDINDERLDVALDFGASNTVNAKNTDPKAVFLKRTSQRGADFVFVTTGSQAAINQGLTLLRRGGTLVLVGMPAEGVKTQFETVDFIDDNQSILGCKMGEVILSRDIPKLLELYQEGRLKLDELVGKQYPLAEINDAIDANRNGIGLRAIVTF